MSLIVPNNKKSTKRKRPLPFDKQIKLCNLVKERPLLWVKSHPNYKKNDLRALSWNEVAAEMDLTTEICKSYWESFRDKHRYITGRRRKKYLNESDEDPDAESQDTGTTDDDLNEWRLWDHYKFMVEENAEHAARVANALRKRKKPSNESTIIIDESNINEIDKQAREGILRPISLERTRDGSMDRDFVSTSVLCSTARTPSNTPTSSITSDCDYLRKRRKQCEPSGSNSNAAMSNTLKSFGEYFQREDSLTRPQNNIPTSSNQPLFFALEFIKTQLEKLPEMKVQDLLQKFMTMTFEAVQEHALLNSNTIPVALLPEHMVKSEY